MHARSIEVVDHDLEAGMHLQFDATVSVEANVFNRTSVLSEVILNGILCAFFRHHFVGT